MRNPPLRRLATTFVFVIGCSWVMRVLLAFAFRNLPRSSALDPRTLRIALATVLPLVAVILTARLFRWRPRQARGAPRRAAAAALLLGTGLPLPTAALVDSAVAALETHGLCSDCGRYFLRGASATPHDVASMLAVGVLVSVLVEEFFFRELLFESACRVVGTRGAVLVSTVGFVLCHSGLVTMLQALLLGLCLGALRARTSSAVPSAIAHASFNFEIAAAASLLPIGVATSLSERAADLSFRWIGPALVMVVIGYYLLCRGSAADAARPMERPPT